MINSKKQKHTLGIARVLAANTIARPEIAAAILGVTRKHLHDLAKRSDFPPKIRCDRNLQLEQIDQMGISALSDTH